MEIIGVGQVNVPNPLDNPGFPLIVEDNPRIPTAPIQLTLSSSTSVSEDVNLAAKGVDLQTYLETQFGYTNLADVPLSNASESINANLVSFYGGDLQSLGYFSVAYALTDVVPTSGADNLTDKDVMYAGSSPGS